LTGHWPLKPTNRSVATSGPSIRLYVRRRAAEVLHNLTPLPIRSKEARDASENDPGHEGVETGAKHRPVEPEAARVVQEVDRESHD
jgi:hypothetical protein